MTHILQELSFYLSYPFVRYALIVGVLIALCSSLLGVTLVLKRFSFIGDGLSHVAFGAMAVATIFKLVNNTIFIMPVTIIAAVLLLRTGQNTKIKIGELLFAGIIISALGAVMDVGMSIASTIQEIYETDKTLSMKRLFVSGINVGRDMMGTMTNTLIFAYVGGAMTTLVINYAYDLSYRQLANSYVIGIEIMQGLSGSLGVVLTVPITALIASFLAVRKK